MKRLLLIITILLTFMLIGCKPVTTEESIYEPTFNHLDYISYYGYLNSENIFILMVREPILDTHYNTENGCYEYEMYGSELKQVIMYENGTLDIVTKDGDRVIIKDYIAFFFDN